MSQARKHRGYRSQKVLAMYLAENGFPFAESTGAGRSGSDVTGTVGIDWEVKARTGFSPAETMRQMKDRAKDGDIRIAVLRLNGQGEKSICDWVCMLTVEQLVNLLRDAGFGDSTNSNNYDQGYDAGWEAAHEYYYVEGDQMPVPEGVITTTDILEAVVPEVEDKTEEEDDDK